MKTLAVCVGMTLFLNTACQRAMGPAAASDPASPPLAGTSWRLIEIQSMDDEIGTARHEGNAPYTMTFGQDGRVSMVLNCNRANGPWSATSAGSLQIGPLAMTRAFCAPPSLDTRIARDMDYVRSYLLKDGRLYLSLMADGGIYAWEPLPTQ